MLHVLCIMQLLVLRSLQLHVKLLHVVVINGNGLLSHGGLGHLVHLLHSMIVMVQRVLVHLQQARYLSVTAVRSI